MTVPNGVTDRNDVEHVRMDLTPPRNTLTQYVACSCGWETFHAWTGDELFVQRKLDEDWAWHVKYLDEDEVDDDF